MIQLLKERNEELERLAEENQRLTKEIEAYAVVLQGCMEAQELWNQKVRVTLLVRVGVFLLCLTSMHHFHPSVHNLSTSRLQHRLCTVWPSGNVVS